MDIFDTRLEQLSARLQAALPRLVADKERALQHGILRWQSTARTYVAGQLQRLDALSMALEARDPLMPLTRGYALVSTSTGLVRSVDETAPGTKIEVRLADGSLAAILSGVQRAKNRKREKS